MTHAPLGNESSLRIYCAVAQPVEGGVPVTAITTVHKDDYDALAAENAALREDRFWLETALEAEKDDHDDTMKRAQEAWRICEKLAAALEMARGFLGFPIKSERSAAYVADQALGDWRRHA